MELFISLIKKGVRTSETSVCFVLDYAALNPWRLKSSSSAKINTKRLHTIYTGLSTLLM